MSRSERPILNNGRNLNDLTTRVVKCTLDEDQCISLHDILNSFQTAINEEQAWAVCYQTVKCFNQHYQQHQSSQYYLITDPSHLSFHKDGHVHPKTLMATKSTDPGNSRKPAKTSHRLLSSLGIVLFHALDYGLCDDEERTLSKPLELLIERLTTAHELARRQRRALRRVRNNSDNQRMQNSMGSYYEDESNLDEDEADEEDEDEDECANADEGIERDCHEYGDHQTSPLLLQASQLVNFDQVMQMCVSRLSSRESADNHYRAVCRALIAETLELSTFLDHISKGTKELQKLSVVRIESNSCNESVLTLDTLQFHDWARLWIQVIRELRHGVKLKKVDQDMIHNTEYELTPYEMLLDDIRSQRYKLNKVMVNGTLPLKVKKDAHELILDFIRSRPPLVPVSKRVLKPPPPKQVTIYEKLMESIRQEHKLRPAPRPRSAYSFSANTTPLHRPASLATEQLSSLPVGKQPRTLSPQATTTFTTSRRKLIKANIKLDLSLDDDDNEDNRNYYGDEDDDDDNGEQFSTKVSTACSRKTRPMSAYYPSQTVDQDMACYDEINHRTNNANNNEINSANIEAEQNNDANGNGHILSLKRFSTRLFSRERRHSIGGFDSKTMNQPHQSTDDIIDNMDFSEDARNHVATIWESSELGKSLECLSLTLKEVQHIRSVLTKAEIESLGVTKSIKKDLENGKICFTCLKTRFSFWGSWATICKLCNRAICDRCATKMRIPSEQFERVPIYMLSPTPSPPNEKNSAEIFNWPKIDPPNETNKQDMFESENEGESKSLPPKINVSRSRMPGIVRMLTTYHDSSHSDNENGPASTTIQQQKTPYAGPLVKVCRDCKILVRHLIDIGHTNFGASLHKA